MVEEHEVEVLVVTSQDVVQLVVDFEKAKWQRSKVDDLGRTRGRHGSADSTMLEGPFQNQQA